MLVVGTVKETRLLASFDRTTDAVASSRQSVASDITPYKGASPARAARVRSVNPFEPKFCRLD